jgi:hypothetical protein
MELKEIRRKWMRCISHSLVAAAAVNKDKATTEEVIKFFFTGQGLISTQQSVGSDIFPSYVDFPFALPCAEYVICHLLS